MDASVGAILDTLESTGLADNTIVVFTSDNGAWVNPNNGLTARPVKGMGPFDGG
jgi:arylsulfatase